MYSQVVNNFRILMKQVVCDKRWFMNKVHSGGKYTFSKILIFA